MGLFVDKNTELFDKIFIRFLQICVVVAIIKMFITAW